MSRHVSGRGGRHVASLPYDPDMVDFETGLGTDSRKGENSAVNSDTSSKYY